MLNDDAARCSTGIPGLDDVLNGGLLRNRLYLLDGNPGAGKTTMALQFLLEGRRLGERCLYVTLSESADELVAGARSHGWSLEGIEIMELIEGSDLHGEDELTMYHPSEVELTDTTRRVVEAVDRLKPARMVFDSLSEMRLIAQSSLRYRRQILALKQLFVGRHCTVLLLDDRTADGSDLQLQSIAHGVISLDQRAPAYGQALRQLRVVKFRGSDFRSGHQDFAIRRGGLDVYPRLLSREHGSAFERVPVTSGVTLLDTLLGGGIERGTSTLLVGPPGCGKSTVAMQYASAAAARGDHAAVFAFEETPAVLIDRATDVGMQIKLGTGPGEMSVRRVNPAHISPGEFAHNVRASVERDGARVIVIDSLNGYLNAMPEDQALTVQLHELLAYLNNQGVVTFLVMAQSGMMGSMRSPVDASYLADSVVMLRFFELAGRMKKSISVLKKRSGRHEEAIREIWFDSAGLHLGPPLEHLRGVLTGVPTERGAGHGDDRAAAGRVDGT